MTSEGAHRAVTTSAVIVGMVYAYRRLFEGSGQTGATVASANSLKQLAGQGPPPPLSHWIIGFGFAFLVISAVAQADPNMGGGFALLLMTGTVMTQGQQMLSDLTAQLSGQPGASADQSYGIGAQVAAGASTAGAGLSGGAAPRGSGGFTGPQAPGGGGSQAPGSGGFTGPQAPPPIRLPQSPHTGFTG